MSYLSIGKITQTIRNWDSSGYLKPARFSLLQNIFNHFNTEIEIIDNTEKTEQEELIEDLVQIITVFGARISGKRVYKAKEIVEQLKGSD